MRHLAPLTQAGLLPVWPAGTRAGTPAPGRQSSRSTGPREARPRRRSNRRCAGAPDRRSPTAGPCGSIACLTRSTRSTARGSSGSRISACSAASSASSSCPASSAARAAFTCSSICVARRRARPWQSLRGGGDEGRAGPAEGMVCWSLLTTTCSRASARSDQHDAQVLVALGRILLQRLVANILDANVQARRQRVQRFGLVC